MDEPVRKSHLDIVKSNLRAANRVTFCTRIIYFGEYNNKSEIFQKQIRNIISSLNTEYSDTPMYGLLIIYPRHFIHILTSSEYMIYRHLKIIFVNKKGEIQLGKVLPLPVHHHVYQPYFTSWYSVITDPPILLEKLENTELTEIQKHVKNIMLKIYNLSEYIMDSHSKSGETIHQILKDIEKKVPEYLPENSVLEFLLKSNTPVLQDVREHLKQFMEIPSINFYHDRIWPTPSIFMPENIHLKPKEAAEENDDTET